MENDKIDMNKFLRPKDIFNYESASSLNLIAIVSNILLKKGKKSNKEYYKIIAEDNEAEVSITVFDIKDIRNIAIGDFIIANCNLTSFGLAKNRNTQIKVYKNPNEKKAQTNTLENFDTIIVSKKGLESYSLF